jgi:TP901 family phage tail tape measure protein
MGNSDLELSLKIKSAVEGLGEVAKLADEIEQLGGDASEVRNKAAQLSGEMAKLGQQQALIDQFKQLSGAARTADEALAQSQQQTRDLALQYKQSQANIEAVENALKNARKALSGAFSPAEIKPLEAEIKALETELKAAQKESAQLETAFNKSRTASRDWAGAAQTQHLELQKLGQQMNAAGLDAGKLDVSQARVTLGLKEAQKATEAFGHELHTQAEQMRAAATAEQDLAAKTKAMQSALDAAGAAGSAAIAKIDAQAAAMKRLSAASHDAMAEITGARAHLGVQAFAEIEAEIEKTRKAFETLKQSGTLSQAEIAQAALKTEERINELKHATNGWIESLTKSREAFLQAGAAGAGLVAASQQAIQFESALADVAKTTGMSASEVTALGHRLKALSTELPINADGLAQIAAAGGQLGIANNQIEQFVTLAATMSSAFDIPVEKAGEAVAALTNNFGLSIEEVGRLGDTINVLGNKTAASEKDIVDALTRIGGPAKQFGLSAEQAAGLADAMLALKMPTEEASTAINALLSKLQTARVGSKSFQEGLGQLGLSADQMAAQVAANPQKALSDFLHTLEKLDAQSRAEILTQMFGEEHQDEIGRLVNALGQFDTAMGIVADKTGAAGAMQKEYEAKLKTTEAHLQLMKNAVEEAAINLGQAFLPAIREVAGGIKTAAQAIADFEQAFPGITALVGSLATIAASVSALRLALLALRIAGVGAFGWAKDLASQANKPLGEVIGTVGKLKVGLGVLSAAWAGWDLGTWSRNNFEVVYKSGVALTAGLTRSFEAIRYGWEVTKAVFTSDTIEAATQRHKQRLQEIDDTYTDLFSNWKLQTDQQGQATDKLTQKQGEMGKAGQQSGEEVSKGQKQAAQATDDFSKALAEAAKATEGGAKKLDELITQYDLLKPDNADKLELAMRKLGGSSEGAAREVREQLAKALQDMSGPDLQAKIDSLRAKTQEIGPIAKEVATQLDLGVREQFRRLGIDADQALTGVSAKVRDDISALDGLAQQFGTSGDAGQRAGRTINQAFTNLINEAQTTEELGAVRAEIDKLGKAGVLTSTQMVQAYRQVDEAQKKIGVSAVDVLAAQDKARISADELAQYAKKAGVDINNLSAALEKDATLQALAAQAADDARESLRLQAAQADDTAAAFSRMAASITSSEQAQATAFRERQIAHMQAVEQRRAAEKEANDEWTQSFKDGEQALSPWVALYQQLSKYGDDYVQTMRRLGEQLVGTNDWWSDLDYGAQVLAGLNDKMAQVNDITQRLGSNDMATLRKALDDATGGMWNTASATNSAGAYFAELGQQNLGPLNAAIQQAVERMRQLEESAQSTLTSLQNELDQMEGRQDAIERRNYESRKAQIQQQLDQARMAGNSAAVSDLQEALRVLERIHDEKLRQLAGKRAAGGPVDKDKTYLVGEEGPELFVPDGDGTIIPNHRLSRGSLQASPAGMDPDLARQISGHLAQIAQGAAAEKTIAVRLEGGGHAVTARIPTRDEPALMGFLEELKQSRLRTFG